MKNTIKLLAVVMLMGAMACQQIPEETSTVVLSGKIENFNTEMVIFDVQDGLYPLWSDTAYLSDDGSFKIKFEFDSCMPVILNDGVEISQMYICPGDSLFITLNTEEFDESIYYEGKGSVRNNILANYFLKFNDQDKEDYIDLRYVKDTSMLTFFNLTNQLGKEMIAFVSQLKEQNDLEDAFIKYMETDAYFTRMLLLTSPWGFRSRQTDTSEIAKELREEIKQIVLEAANYEDPDWLNDNFQRYYLHGLEWCFLHEIFDEHKSVHWKTMDSLFYPQYKNAVPPKMFQKYLKDNAVRYHDSYEPVSLERIIYALDNYCTDPAYKEKTIREYQERLEKVNQEIPEGTVMIDLNDEEYVDFGITELVLSYPGKVIYLEFWSSSCRPCIKEMPYADVLASRLKEEDFVILYINMDYQFTPWERVVRYLQKDGIHYRLNTNSFKQISKELEIKFIPHYILVDKAGNLVINPMTPPSDPDTEKKIRELL